MAKIIKMEPFLPKFQKRKRVAAYARVSMETELLHHSLSAQVSHYSSLIQSNPEWEYAGVYADEGISGTSTKKRDEFNRLIQDCDDGKIDIVLVKSVSRFARDTIDTLSVTRHLKDIGIDVYFEREGIHSISNEGELLLTLLASFAQAEAESISENAKWSVQKRMERGEPNTGIDCFGYDWNPKTKTLIINEEEAKWVRYIYKQYLDGASIKGLTADLRSKGVNGKRGTLIERCTVRRILTSETYVGDLLLQKYYCESINNAKRNNGEVPQYLVTDNHEPLVSREDFAKVQERINQRAQTADNVGYVKSYFAGLVKCGKCGYSCSHVKNKNCKREHPDYLECNRRKSKQCDLLPMGEHELIKIMESLLLNKNELEKILIFDDHIDFFSKKGATMSCIRKYPKGGYNATPFSRKIFCGHCGASIKMSSSRGRMVWYCKTKMKNKSDCIHISMTEKELYGAARDVIGSDENLEMRIYCQIEKTVSYNDRIEFFMKDGSVKVWQR